MKKNKIKGFFFSELIMSSNATKRIVYVAVLTAINIVTGSILEFRIGGGDTQFSITIAVSVLSGVLLGSVFGFVACFVGDLIGFFISSWGYLYMPWVGLSTAVTAFIAGVIVNGFKWKFKGQTALKVILVCLLSLFICTIAINSTGFYFYNYHLGFTEKVINYVKDTFGTNVGYLGYLAYRMIFKGQIFNCLFNYALIGIVVPLVLNVKMFQGKKPEE